MTERSETETVRLEIVLSDKSQIPYRKRITDAGYDIYSIEDKQLLPNKATIVQTGIRIAAPRGYYYTIEGRSSLWQKGIFPNRGIIDATFCGELVVSMVNTNDEPFEIKSGDRIAQILIHKQIHARFDVVEEFSKSYNERGTEGFGSTGR